MKKEISKALKDIRAELEQIRNKVASRKAEHDRIKSSAIAFEERRAALDAEIDFHAQSGRKRFFNLAHVAEISKENRQILPDALGSGPASQRNIVEFLSCAFNRELKENLSKELKTLWPADAIGAQERKEKLAQIEEELRQLENNEESITIELEDLGVEVERRPDLSPEIFLEVKEG